MLQSIVQILRSCKLKLNRKRLRNRAFSLISNDCNGGFILKDLGLKYNSPFANLWIKPTDYIRLLQNLRYYMSLDLNFVTELGIAYPVGELGDIRIYFPHYHTAKEAQEKWNKRRNRIDYDNLYILFDDRNGCTYQNLLDFDSLPYTNKIVFTHLPYPELKSVKYFKGWEGDSSVGFCFEYKGRYSLCKHYDAFDFVHWFNQKID